ncbi:MAG: hypothetical protein JO052_16545 [Bradyrhizobium sp.]|nr:hypothetical protein [Bradyrhizobium sp.]
MSEPALRLSGTFDRAGKPAAGPQRTVEPCRGLLGRRGFGIRLQELDEQPIGALALAFEIGTVAGGGELEPRDVGCQLRDFLPQRGGFVGRATVTRPWRMPYFGEINTHQGLAVVRKRTRQVKALGQGTGGLRRDVQAGAKCGICQRLNGHRLFSSNEPGGNRLMTGRSGKARRVWLIGG